ncbi:FxLYD domain-containing protein [Marininema halotolerans]|uniref:Lipoprotein n=1 Tax=Marininema halotolerans TaxID=1155944 RepID=A0A1I6SLV8_9BACL|nr:FxLYD domain-containing protein [Marininema halotolerans]SFS77921.1 hypothetical protein SAMN05444972_107189 [Marininema halotolerans]
MNTWIRHGMILISGMIFLAGCQSDEEGTAQKRAKVLQAEKVAKQERKENLRVETKEETGQAWKDKHGKVKAVGAAAILNTGKKAVKFDSVQLQFLNKDGKVIAKKEVLTIVPQIVKPGETAYVGSVHDLTSIKDPKELHRVIVKPHAIPALKPIPHIQLTDIVGQKDDHGKVSIKGTVKNQSKAEMKDILLSATLRDRKGHLLAVVNDYLDVKIPGGKSAAFTASDQTLPKDILKQVDEKNSEVGAYPLIVND